MYPIDDSQLNLCSAIDGHYRRQTNNRLKVCKRAIVNVTIADFAQTTALFS